MRAQKSTRSADKLLIEISSEEFNWILRYANESSPVYLRLKNSTRIAADTMAIPCDVAEAQMLLDVPSIVPTRRSKIDHVIKAFRDS